MCDYCESGKPLVERNGRRVLIEGGCYLKLRWNREDGRERMRWERIAFCPMCGRSLKEE